MTSSEISVTVSAARAAAQPARNRRLLQKVAAYGMTRGATEGLLALRSVVLAAMLGPAAFGTWALLRLGMRYSGLAGLGVFRGLELELLQADAQGRTLRRGSPAPAALGFILAIGGSVSALALGAALVVQDSYYRLLLVGFSAASLAESLYSYALVCTRVRSTLRHYAILETTTAVLHVACAVSFARLWGLGGAFAGLALANFIGIAGAWRWVEFRPTLELEPLRRLLRIGLPVALTSCVAILLMTADRWIVAIWGGATMLGYYAFGASVTTAAAALALVIRTVVFRDVYGETTSDGAPTALRAHLERALLPYARLLPPLLGAAGLVAGPAVALAMPGYTQAIAPARLFLLAGVAIGLVNLSSVGVIAAGRQRRLPIYSGIALAVTSGLSVLALLSGQGLEGVAAAALVGYLLYAAGVLRLIVRETGATDVDRFVGMTLLPIVWCAAAVAVVGRLLPGSDIGSVAMALALYCLLLLPLVPAWRTEWRRLGH